MMFVMVTKIVNNTEFWRKLRDIFSKKTMFLFAEGV